MAMKEVGARLTADSSQFKNEMKSVNSSLGALKAEMKATTAEFQRNSSSAQALAARQEILSRTAQTQAQKVDMLQAAYDEVVGTLPGLADAAAKAAAEFGENSEEAQKAAEAYAKAEQTASRFAAQINNAKADLINTNVALQDTAEAAENASAGTSRLASFFSGLGSAAAAAAEGGLNAASRAMRAGGQVIRSAGAAVGAGTAAIAAGIATAAVAFAKGIKDLTEYGDNVDKMSQKLGMSTDAYQEWSYILGQSGASIDAMKTGMASLEKAAQGGSEAFQKLGISAQDLQSMNSEELFSATIQGLQGMDDGMARTALAMELFGKQGMELAPLLNTSVEETEAMRQAAHDLGGVMSEDTIKACAAFGDSMDNLKLSITGAARGLLADFLPGLTKVTDGMTEILKGNGEGGLAMVGEGVHSIVDQISAVLPDVAESASQLAVTIMQALTDNLPLLLEAGTSMATTLLTGVLSLAPELIPAGFELLNQLLTGLSDAMPQLGEIAMNAVQLLLTSIIDNGPQLISSGMSLLAQVISGLAQAMPQLIPQAMAAVTTLLSALIQNAPQLLLAGLELIGALISGIIDNLPQLLTTGAELLMELVDSFSAAAGDFQKVGSEIINKLLEGLKAAWDGVISWGMAVFDAFKGIFSGGINVDIHGSTSGAAGSIPGHAMGLDYVPYDNYLARLHQGEAVLTAQEAAQWRSGQSGQRAVTVNIYPQDLSNDQIYEVVRIINEELGEAVS